MRYKDILTLYDYNDWADKRLLSAAAKVTHEQFIAPAPFPHGSLRGTLVHTLDGECMWGHLLRAGDWAEELKEADFPTFADLEKSWQSEERLMREYLASLDDEAVQHIVRYISDTGVQRERELWHCMFHLVNHGTQHRSEAAALLTEFGQSPGDVDFTIFLNERK